MAGTLYLVATPIGNLADMTFRAVDVLRSVDVIACEDTRHTQKLLNHYRIATRTVSYHEHNEHERAEELVESLIAGRSVAVVSDAGTPGICDPGSRMVLRAAEAGIAVVPVPGAVAFVNAIIASGLASDRIFFGGFLPSKKGDRRKRLDEVRDIPATLVFYETPHRIARSLIDCLEILGERRAAVARELTKLHEEMRRGTLSELVRDLGKAASKGEFVLVIEQFSQAKKQFDLAPSKLQVRIDELVSLGESHRSALKKAAKEFGLSKSEAYRLTQIR